MYIKTEEVSVKNRRWKQYTLGNNNGMEVTCLNYGGIITRVLTPNKENQIENVVLGYQNLEDYIHNPGYLGALIGRVAGRIEGASFTLDEQKITLPANDNGNHLHGGPTGFHQVVWDVVPYEHTNEVGLQLFYSSPDGEGGYPGNLSMKVTYSLTNQNAFTITYEGISDEKTVLAPTNHSYFNLSGNLKSTILNHEVTINSNRFVELDGELIPTGDILPVEDTVFDFRTGRQIKDGVTSKNRQNIIAGNGYDHYFLFDDHKGKEITVKDFTSGRKLTVTTDEPGFVMYTSNNLPSDLQLIEGLSRKYLGLCLETQGSPASLHNNGFPSIVIDAHEKYISKTTFQFDVM